MTYYTVYFTLYAVYYYPLHCPCPVTELPMTLYNLHCTLYTVYCMMSTLHGILYNVYCALFPICNLQFCNFCNLASCMFCILSICDLLFSYLCMFAICYLAIFLSQFAKGQFVFAICIFANLHICNLFNVLCSFSARMGAWGPVPYRLGPLAWAPGAPSRGGSRPNVQQSIPAQRSWFSHQKIFPF